MRDYTTWEEDFDSDVSQFHDEEDRNVGSVKPVGGSWQAIYKGETIAIRPTKAEAQSAVLAMHEDCG